ncbi:MAG TPA: rhodanese-like domain-containing protein [Phycisphaerae bacterium]|nr:rhodanese-like domain-containing protein [Phycisphaerae bacterium]HOJ74353.1 rhodanese-like domain-containing protein [Phycisphaerae bacterium]HOM52977.1 rhodanese-like domain-containing protein [Phycisphaerae bacterium]HON69356.1 rhodanese-like domain-containing protein [Phycisphaerae bacterium]HOQ88171.1 rhodanese-like domain-containing protein [Phycisphaerae bacterium]
MRELKRILLEALIIAAAGAAVGLTANAMNVKGLKLFKNHFPPPPTTTKPTLPDKTTAPARDVAREAGGTTQSADVQVVATDPAVDSTPTPPLADDPYAGLAPEVRAKLEAYSLQPIRLDELLKLYEDPLYAANLYVIIDARDDRDYAEGHIPGAFQLFHYRAEQFVDAVVPAAQAAEKVIVYCNGGDCDDSVFTADLLRRDHAIDPGRVFVYPEGFEGWKKAGLPIEIGVRGSGIIKEGGN